MDAVARAARQALAVDEQDDRVELARESRRQRHRVRPAAEERRPHPFPARRHLVGEDAHDLAILHRLHQHAHPAHLGGREPQAVGGAAALDERTQDRLVRNPVQHGHRPRLRLGPERRVELRGDLEAAQVGRQEHHRPAVGRAPRRRDSVSATSMSARPGPRAAASRSTAFRVPGARRRRSASRRSRRVACNRRARGSRSVGAGRWATASTRRAPENRRSRAPRAAAAPRRGAAAGSASSAAVRRRREDPESSQRRSHAPDRVDFL